MTCVILSFFDNLKGFSSRGSLVPYPTFSFGVTLGIPYFQDLDNNMKEL